MRMLTVATVSGLMPTQVTRKDKKAGEGGGWADLRRR